MIFQHAIEKAYLYAKRKGYTTLGASRKFETESQNLLHRELKVAEHEATLAIVAAMQSVKTALLKGIASSMAVWHLKKSMFVCYITNAVMNAMSSIYKSYALGC